MPLGVFKKSYDGLVSVLASILFGRSIPTILGIDVGAFLNQVFDYLKISFRSSTA